MDIKELNKPQLILLALLISFITSLATGIITVTLMQQAPVSFTSPVNRVIKQTVEKIQQVEGKTTVQTVVVKEEDLVVDAIAKNQSAIFAVSKEVLDSQGNLAEVPAGKGFAVSTDGIIVTDASFIPGSAQTFYVKNDSGKFKASFISTDKAGFSFVKAGASVDSKDKIAFTVPVFGDINKMKAGQKIIILGNAISSVIYDGNKEMKINGIAKSNAGGLVLDLDGQALGITLSGDSSSFASIKNISDALAASVKANAVSSKAQ